MKIYRFGIGIAAAAVLTAIFADGASAAKKNTAYVTAKSDFGNGKITAPVRQAQYGKQVQLPSGMWYYCELSCADTLRREVLDFWETRSEEQGESDFD